MAATEQLPVVLPVTGRRNVLVTSALPYVNNVPHLGNLVGCVLSADAYARYCRLRGHNVLFICGTDEYGTTTETKAMEEGCSPREICDKYHAIHRQVYEWFDISFDHFGRTSSPQQTEICQDIFRKLLDNWLSENTIQQLYCNSCQKFLADRLVEGSCPKEGCGYDSACGDQCDKFLRLVPTLGFPSSTERRPLFLQVCSCTPCVRDTNHLFLELPLLKEKLEKYIDEVSGTGSWSQNAVHTTNAWLQEGLKPRCITRDLKWGVPVPHEKYKDKVFYVWFDAPIGYISITACYTPEWEKWWKNPDNVELYQFMGKDSVPFHTVMFPSTLLGTGENWTLMKTISVTEYLNYESGITSFFPASPASDTQFNWTDLQAKLNNELLNNLGNFINRVLSFIAKPEGTGYGSIIPDAPNAESHTLTQQLAKDIGDTVEKYIEAMDKVKLKQGLKYAMAISKDGNHYLQNTKFWKLYKQDPASCAIVMKTSVGVVHLLACLLEPFMPSFSKEVLQELNFCPVEHLSFSDEKGDRDKAGRPWDLIPSGHKIGRPAPLFKGLANDAVQSFREKFAGKQDERRARAVVAAQLEAIKL
ncbi:hypothetical protein PR202_gb07927 [Eleusine coracana subsp. coracana]|uniref:methionine--tRNA ligase n=1 Tax=Eleusine coracana subsp. coracana TaxID=191504 RepID=A0AAV5EEE7_ELECO|nr:hypothetical protein PR202_gb07927 [Eleusine coracana subsp. coracana]